MKAWILFILFVIVWDRSYAGNGAAIYERETIIKIEMHLSAFGVESDDYPNIDAVIDFAHDTAVCKRWYFNPSYKSITYFLSKENRRSILNLLSNDKFKTLKGEYTVEMTDQPNSKLLIYTDQAVYTINDYGLKGDNLLGEIYKIVYAFK